MAAFKDLVRLCHPDTTTDTLANKALTKIIQLKDQGKVELLESMAQTCENIADILNYDEVVDINNELESIIGYFIENTGRKPEFLPRGIPFDRLIPYYATFLGALFEIEPEVLVKTFDIIVTEEMVIEICAIESQSLNPENVSDTKSKLLNFIRKIGIDIPQKGEQEDDFYLLAA